MTRKAFCFVVFGFLLLGSLAAPALAQYGGGTAALNKNAYAPGEAGTGTLSGALAQTRYQADFAQSPGVIIGNGTTDANGRGTVSFTIPTAATVGSATLTFDPDGTTSNNIVSNLSIVAATSTAVASPGPTTTPGVVSLPVTGAGIAGLSTVGLSLIALGTVLVLNVRRRTALAMRSGSATASDDAYPEDVFRGLSATRFGRGADQWS